MLGANRGGGSAMASGGKNRTSRTNRQPITGFRSVRRHRRVGQVIALALHDVGREPRRRVRDGFWREEPDVADEQTADHRVLARTNRAAPVAADVGPHLLHAVDPVGFAEQLPRLRYPQPGRVAEEAPADQPVVRVVGLEEKRLARRQDTELTGTAGLPEIHLGRPRPGRQEPVPAVIRDTHVRPHNEYSAPAAAFGKASILNWPGGIPRRTSGA